jgi:hypothetical protein
MSSKYESDLSISRIVRKRQELQHGSRLVAFTAPALLYACWCPQWRLLTLKLDLDIVGGRLMYFRSMLAHADVMEARAFHCQHDYLKLQKSLFTLKRKWLQ